MQLSVPHRRAIPRVIASLVVSCVLGILWSQASRAGTFSIGLADGSFETGWHGMQTIGEAELVATLGPLRPTQGTRALLLTTAPDDGASPEQADVSLVRIEPFLLPADVDQLRLDVNFLTNEPTPSFTNDRFAMVLAVLNPQGEETLHQVDTFDPTYPAPWTGYAYQTGFRTVVVDVATYAGTGEPVTLELRLADTGDGRGESAVLIDNMQLAAADEPLACANAEYLTVNPGEAVALHGVCSSDSGGAIVLYHWDFGDGTRGTGRFVEHAYTTSGLYRVTLTVTDNAGHTSTDTFTIAVGSLNQAPEIVSPPVTVAAENTPYHYQVVATDAELAFGDTLTFRLLEAPAGMEIDPDTGLLTWIPSDTSPRHHAVTVQVADSTDNRATQTFTVVVGPEVYIVSTHNTGRIYAVRSNGDGTFADYRFVEDTGSNTEGAVIADFDGDGDFDFISGHAQNATLFLYYYEKQATRFVPPVLLATLPNPTTPPGSWLEDMAAGDMNDDGHMDVAVNGNGANTWLFLNQGALTFGETAFLQTDFETTTAPWDQAQCRTAFGRDTATAASGSGSMRVLATASNACLGLGITPTGWQLFQGPFLRFAYRIPSGVPVGMYVHVAGYGWLFLGGSPGASTGGRAATTPTALVDDDQWHTVSIDLYQTIRQQWPEATEITEFQWSTQANAPAGAQFWFDDFAVTRRTYVSGFTVRQLSSAGGSGRGLDAADVDGDGHLDLVRGRCCDGLLHVYQGDGSGQFTSAGLATAGNEPYGVALADFDNDGRVDMLASHGTTGTASFFKGQGDGTFQAGVSPASLATEAWAAYGAYDLNGDGKQDLVVADWASRRIWYYPGQGNATFGPRVPIGSTPDRSLGIATPAGRRIGQPFSRTTQDRHRIVAGGTVTFDARDSYDDGLLVSYAWDFGDGTTGSGAVVTHTFVREGLYTVLLVVTDQTGQQDRRYLRVTVTGAPPAAHAGGPYVAGEAAATLGRWSVTFDGSTSADADTHIARYEWDFDASDGLGIDATEVRPQHVYTAPGIYTVTLTVYDAVGQSVTAMTTVTVSAGAPPVAHAGGAYLFSDAGTFIQFTSSASSDDVAIAKYLWRFGDGTTSLEAHPRHFYAQAGPYTVTLTVTDHALQTHTATTSVRLAGVNRVDTSAMVTEGQTLAVSGVVRVEITAPGTFPGGPVSVLFFEDRDRNGQFDPPREPLLGQAGHNGLTAGATVVVSAPVSGTLSFRDAPITAVLQGQGFSALLGVSSSQDCTVVPPVGAFQPVLKWQWTGSAVVPESNQVKLTPAVIDLNADGVPDVVFSTFTGSNYFTGGLLRAVSGRDGHELFTVTHPLYYLRGASGIAGGDLDLDGRPEIVTVDESGSRLIAFAHDGTFKWRSPVIPGGGTYGSVAWGTPALADLDRDGVPEIVVGATVLNHDGSLRWTGAHGIGDNVASGEAGPVSLAADLDLQGDLEVVAGNTAYRADGSLYWQNQSLTDGYTAVANFDADPFPEIVLVTRGRVYLLEHDGTVKWGPVMLPGALEHNAGGPPTIADVDGDGEPEIGVAGGYAYTVLETDGTIKWSQPTQDLSSAITGSSVFDFEGDGAAEIIYGDELVLRIYRGSDGAVLWETPSSNGTTYEYPVIVDVDADGHADIVKVSNNYHFPGSTGIQVYSDAQNTWVPTRQVWNQHAYSVYNINDDGTIPRDQVPAWQAHNTYRLNRPTQGHRFAAPDLTAALVRLTPEDGPTAITARIGNAGTLLVPMGVPVAFYDGEPQAGGRLLGTASTTMPLTPGAYEDVTLRVHGTTWQTVWVVADGAGEPGGTVSECREDNNLYNSGLRLRLNQPPIAHAGGPYSVVEGTLLTLDGRASSDPDGDTLTYAWDLNHDGVFDDATGATVSFPCPEDGSSAAVLRVSDGTSSHTDTALITVTNAPPGVEAGPDQTVDPGVAVKFAGAFTDPGVTDTQSIRWDFGDGTGATGGLTPTHAYATPGTYAVRLTVQDDDGGVGSDTLQVTVRGSQQTITDLYARAKLNIINLVWTPVVNAVRYEVYRSANGAGFVALGSVTIGVYADLGLTTGVRYCYQVRSIAANGTASLPSNEACATPTTRAR